MHKRRHFTLISTFALLVISTALFSSAAKAEYRAYELLITDTQTGQSRKVLSTLDHLQYPGYHHLALTDLVAIEDTWMCWGRSDRFKPICPNPGSAAGPTANNAPPAPPAP